MRSLPSIRSSRAAMALISTSLTCQLPQVERSNSNAQPIIKGNRLPHKPSYLRATGSLLPCRAPYRGPSTTKRTRFLSDRVIARQSHWTKQLRMNLQACISLFAKLWELSTTIEPIHNRRLHSSPSKKERTPYGRTTPLARILTWERFMSRGDYRMMKTFGRGSST